MIVPLLWKLVILVSGSVLAVSAVLVLAFGHVRGVDLWAMPIDQFAVKFTAIALVNATVWTSVAVGLAFVFVRRITRPLAWISAAADSIVSGELAAPVPVPEADEMGVFTMRFNRLVGALAEQRNRNEALLAELNRANAQLTSDVRRSERLAALGTLSAGLAHELNNLLNCIGGYAHVMAAEIQADSPLAEDVRMIRLNTGRASELLYRFLQFARPAAILPGLGDLNAIIDSGVTMLSLQLATQKVVVRRDVPTDLPVIVCDPVLIEQALFNLMLNAVQAMKSGGELSIVARMEEGDRVSITISDTGPGISPDDLPHVFDPFFTTKGPDEGTGLGLAIAHTTIEKHGGTIDIESHPGCGTRVRVVLPVHPRKDA